MDENTVLQVGREALEIIVLLSAPLLLSALLVGLLISIFQAATQIQEQTLSFIPKLMAIVVALIIMGQWMLNLWVSYTQELYFSIPELIG